MAKWGIGLVLALSAVLVVWSLQERSFRQGIGPLSARLENRGRVALLGGSDLKRLAGRGTELVDAEDLPSVRDALRGRDESALVAALEENALRAVLVDGRTKVTASEASPLETKLRAYRFVTGLRAEALAPTAALYVPAAPPAFPAAIEAAIGTVARGILAGQRAPHLRSFPEPLRRIEPVEVMVMLRDGERARLWRSARASSIGQGLVTAASVARERWKERETAMGGPLAKILPTLTVEVSLLVEDGTLTISPRGFLDRAITTAHGVGFEQKGRWRYLLPSARRAAGTGSEAFRRVIEDGGIDIEAIDRPDLRAYRFVVAVLSVSPPEPVPSKLSGVRSASESDAATE